MMKIDDLIDRIRNKIKYDNPGELKIVDVNGIEIKRIVVDFLDKTVALIPDEKEMIRRMKDTG